MHEGTGGAPIDRTSFGPITRENSREAIKILGGLVRDRCRPLGHAHRTMGVQDPLCNAAPLRLQGQETTYPKGSLKWSSLNQSVQELRNKGAIEPAPLTPGFYSRLFLVRKATGEWRPIIDLSSLNVFVHCTSFTMETPRSILRALHQGQWLTSLDLKDAYFHIGIDPADRHYLRFCHNGTAWQFTVLPFGLSTSPRVFTKILKPVLAYAHLHRVKLHMYIDDWLLNPGTHQEALEQTSWLRSLCQKLGLVLNLEKSDLIPSQVSTYLGIELDTSVGLARPSHKWLTNWLSVAEGFTAQQSPPAVQWLQVLGHLVSNSHSPHSMAIETPVESVEGEILKTDPTRPSVPPGHPMVDQQGQFTKGSPNRDHRCEGCSHVRQHVSGCLPEKSGGHQIAHNERFSHRHMSVVREEGMTLVPRYLPGHLNVLADHLSRRGQILKTEWSLNQTVADRIFRAWGRPFVDLFALGKNTKLAIYVSPIREETSWKVDSLVQNWDGLYAYAYPPTSLIRACLNKVRTENVEIVLIAPAWPNQEWFPDLLDLSIDFPITLPPVQKLLKQTFSHHFHPHLWLLNLHAWRLSKDSTRREDFLKRFPKGSLYLKRQSSAGVYESKWKVFGEWLILSRQLSNS